MYVLFIFLSENLNDYNKRYTQPTSTQNILFPGLQRNNFCWTGTRTERAYHSELTLIMLLQATIGRKYFAEIQTIVASFGPSDLSLIFLRGMDLEVTPL